MRCAAAHSWIVAGGIGQWVLFAGAAATLASSRRRPGLRRATTVLLGATAPLAVGWFVASMAIAMAVQPNQPWSSPADRYSTRPRSGTPGTAAVAPPAEAGGATVPSVLSRRGGPGADPLLMTCSTTAVAGA